MCCVFVVLLCSVVLRRENVTLSWEMVGVKAINYWVRDVVEEM